MVLRGDPPTVVRSRSSALVSDLAEKIAAPGCVFGGFHAFGRRAVDHAQHATALLVLGYDYAHRIGSRAENGTDFRNILDAAEHIDRITVAHGDDEDVPRAHHSGITRGHGLQRLVVAVYAREARPGGFVERHAEFHLRHRVDQRLVEVFHALDEMRLAQNNISVLWNFER